MSTLKIAVLHQYSDRVTLRAGYSQGDQPVPRDQTFFNIIAPGVVEEHVSLGATFAFNERNELSIAYNAGAGARGAWQGFHPGDARRRRGQHLAGGGFLRPRVVAEILTLQKFPEVI
jgi:long-chain fatty acid transport protein